MSFKRDGDDGSWLNLQQKRRVAELLGLDIPEDEALLLSNGRFACTVCSHRPIFDTVSMLAVHRGGKKHQQNAAYKLQEQQELNLLAQKRIHEQLMKSGSSTLKYSSCSSSHHPLITSTTSIPRPARQRLKPYERRQKISLGKDSKAEPGLQDNKARIFSADGNDSVPQTISDYRKRQHHSDTKEKFELKPYNRKGGQLQASVTSATTLTERVSVIASQKESLLLKGDKAANQGSYSGQTKVYVHPQCEKSKRKKKEKSQTVFGPQPEVKPNQYLTYRGAGWIKDLSGKWVQEEGVEFDSDEEPPDLP